MSTTDEPAASQRGICITLEGTDGTDKSTQAALLEARLRQAGHTVLLLKFPRYSEPSSYFVQQYLAGAYGETDAVNPFAASLFFSLDRYQASFEIRRALAEGTIVVCDRFTGSNMIHQGAKVTDAKQRHEYLVWLDNTEHAILGIPKPTVTLLLTAPLDTITERLAAKQRSSTHIKKDIHEADAAHLHRALEVSLQLCELFPDTFVRIDGEQNAALLSEEAIHEQIWAAAKKFLPTA